MKAIYVLLLAVSVQTFQVCYSTCLTCAEQPYICTSCAPNLILVGTTCVANSQQSILAAEFFPVKNEPGAMLDSKALEGQTFLLQSCTRKNEPSFSIPYLNVKNVFTRVYHRDQVPPHKFISVRFGMLQNEWYPFITVKLTINERVFEINENEYMAKYFNWTNFELMECQKTDAAVGVTSAGVHYFTLSDNNPTLNITFQLKLQEGSYTARFGLNSLLVRYGNCHKSCNTCVGSGSENCQSCRGFLIFNESKCSACAQGFYLENQTCLTCHHSCQTCSGPGRFNCLTCSYNEMTVFSSGICAFADYNTAVFAHELNETRFQKLSGWVINGNNQTVDVSVCGTYSYIGGYGLGKSSSIVSKKFTNLPHHFAVKLSFFLLVVDGHISQFHYTLFLDQLEINGSSKLTNVGSNECGDNTKREDSAFVRQDSVNHSSSNLAVKLRPMVDSQSYFAMRDFVFILQKCAFGCIECDRNQTNKCKRCMGNLLLQNQKCRNCPKGYFKNEDVCKPCNFFCKQCSGPTAFDCVQCDEPMTLAGNTCIQNNQYGMYLFSLNENLKQNINNLNDWEMYPRLLNNGSDKCGPYHIFGNSQIKYRKLTFSKTFRNLPKHTDITVHFQLIFIDDLKQSAVQIKLNGQQIGYEKSNYSENICGNSSGQSILKIVSHRQNSADSFNISFEINEKAKIGLMNFAVFLKGCAACKKQPHYKMEYAPLYDIQENKTGVVYWLDFNEKVEILTKLQDIFSFSLQGNKVVSNLRLLQEDPNLFYNLEKIGDKTYKLFIPLSKSYFNTKLQASSVDPSQIVSTGGNVRPISIDKSLVEIVRYDQPTEKSRRTVSEIFNFFNGVSYGILFASILLIIFGFFVIIEDFVYILQILFLYIYIQHNSLPMSHLYPLTALSKLQFLNFFPEAARRAIENWFLPENFHQPSPHIFQMYQPDINFLRNIYPIIIMNFIFLFFWIIGYFIRENYKDKKSSNPYLKHFLDIYDRPLNLIDSIVRYQYLSVFWACLLQFTHFMPEYRPYGPINAVCCILSFIFVILYPIVTFFYLRAQYSYMTNQKFQYLYSECFYKRLVVQNSPIENIHQYMYHILRYFKYQLIAIAILLSALFSMPNIAIVTMLTVCLVEILWILAFKIYTDKIYMVFKIIEDSLLIVLTCLYIANFAKADESSTQDFIMLGHCCNGFTIGLIVNGILITLYLLYCRTRSFKKMRTALSMQAIENSTINEAERELIRAKTKMMMTSIKNEMGKGSMKKTQKLMGGRTNQITSINQLVQ